MSKFKKVFSFAIACIMSIGMILPTVSAAKLPEDVVGTAYEESVELLNALEIMIGDDTGAFRLEDTIIRSEVAKIAVAIAGLADVAESSKNQSIFPDVPNDHWAVGYINVAQAQGYVIGDDTGNFRPNDKITYAEAVTILMRVLGYEPAAKTNGGYPTGYLVTAGTAGLFKGGVSSSANAEANRGIVAMMAYNALTINLMERTGYGVNETYEVVEKTLLEDKLDVQKLYGQVVATAETTLTGTSSLKKSQVQILVDDVVETYNVNDTNAADFIARNVIFYVREDDRTNDKNLILVTDNESRNTELVVKADHIEDVSENGDYTLSYWVNKDTDKKPSTATINEDAVVFYNGVAVSDYDLTTLTDLTSGYVTLLDTNRSDEYNYVFVTEYQNMVVDEVSTVSNKISDKFNLLTLTLDPEDTALVFDIYKNGEKIEIGDIQEWDILSVASNTKNPADAAVIKVYVSSETISGKVTEIEDEYYTIGDKQYELAANYIAASQPALSLSDEGIFYLDIEGKIAAVDTETRAGSNYAYLVDAATTGTINTQVQFKLFNKDGETVIVNGANKVKVNNKTGLSGDDVVEAIKSANKDKIAQLITYEMNSSGEITYVNTATTNATAGSSLKNTFSLDYVSSEEGVQFLSASNKLGGFNVNSDTLVFDIPADSTDTDDYAVRNMNMFVDKSKYVVEIYDLSEDLTATVVIVKNSTGEVNAENDIAIVKKVVSVFNDDQVAVHKLYALQGGKEIEIMAQDSDVLVKEDSTLLSAGDIIQYQTNARNEINKISVLFDSADRANDEINVLTQYEGTEMTTIVGRVTKKFAGSINVVAENMSEVNLDISNAVIYRYDATKSSNAQVRVVDASYITKYDEAAPEKLFIRTYKGVVTEVVVITEA